MTIRKITFEDLSILFHLAKRFYAEYRENKPLDCPVEDDNMLTAVLCQYATEPLAFGVLAISDSGAIAGMFLGHTSNFICSKGHFAEDRVMYVLPEYRNGIALSKMLKSFELWAKEHGCHSVKLSALASHNNDALAKICERKGYQRTQITLSKLV